MSLKTLEDYVVNAQLIIQVDHDYSCYADLGAVRFIIGPKTPLISFVVFDEYGDARENNQPLCLALLDREFRVLQDANSAEEWANFQSIDQVGRGEVDLYQANQAAMETYINRYGAIPDVVSDMDWQLNTGTILELRNM
jgi:hypothetical protein